MLSHIKALETRTNKERVEYVKNVLKEKSIQYESQPFRLRLLKGENVIVTQYCTPNARNQFLITAHTNKYFTSPGANDNASGVSILLKIAENLRVKNVSENAGIKIVFFDHEDGLAWLDGSTYFVKNVDLSKVSFVLNIDMVGTGSAATISPRLAKEADKYTAYLLNFLDKQKIRYFSFDLPPIFCEDHVPFMKRVPAISLNLLPESDLDYLMHLLRAPLLSQIKAWLLLRFNRKNHPMFIMKHRHNELDTSEFIQNESLCLCEKIIMNLVDYQIAQRASFPKERPLHN